MVFDKTIQFLSCESADSVHSKTFAVNHLTSTNCKDCCENLDFYECILLLFVNVAFVMLLNLKLSFSSAV